MNNRQGMGDWVPVLAYGLLLVYGTLFHLEPVAWDTPVDFHQLFDWEAARKNLSMSDILVNLLVYLPWGYLFCRALLRSHIPLALILTFVAGTALSFSLEYCQLYLPSRVASGSDIFLNALGTFLGSLGAGAFHHPAMGAWMRAWRRRFFIAGGVADLGIVVLGVWALSELTPLVPSLDIGNLKHGVKPLYLALSDPARIQWGKLVGYGLNLVALGLILQRVLRPTVPRWKFFLLLFAGVLTLKIPVVGRQLGLEACVGLLLAALILPFLWRSRDGQWPLVIGMICVVTGKVLEGLSVGDGASLTTYALNWVPFAGQTNGVIGLIDILFAIWPWLALGFFAVSWLGVASGGMRWFGALLVFALAFYLEWRQQWIPGRYPDATDAYLAVAAWLFAWHYAGRQPSNPPQERYPDRHESTKARISGWVVGGGVLVLVVGISLLAFQFQTARVQLENQDQDLIPRPDQLPIPSLPHFRYNHPRLPAPSAAEILEIQRSHSRYLQEQRKRARGGKGRFFSIALSGRVDPGDIDFAQVTRRLLEMKYTWRGHGQGMPMALIYDWLYPYFTPSQRRALQDKLAEGCAYLINFIRKNALSPYNVFLYNSPFQALMAVSIALYGDHPYGDQCMAFTYDFWKHRILPVWRQVMGKHGGWHEGAEYVGIGIGRAVYSLPAMWRRAAGEDLFRTEPGIRGFLDFLVYRRRPDGYHLRWGDGKYFDKWVPERFALALEYRDRAAYGFFGCPRRFQPTAWPWGPLPDRSLCDRKAYRSLPLEKFFDGIGMLISRSDWSEDATYVVFKTGDNFWSHSHLDQGAFTIYKGGPLAIDSGFYGTTYGTDHHLNYSYQTIAHNVITVTDPEDTARLPGKNDKPPRPIANDGGQRRVGSGWGRPAPIDLKQWQSRYTTYHTGRIARYFAGDGLVVAVAELTPAYSNEYCGQGNPLDRTCRVARYWRTFIYDRAEDVVVVYDDVTAVRPEFIKRSLIHSIGRPLMKPGGFVIETPPNPKLHRKGGRLEVEVLFPREAYLNPLGGRGFEFWVDGKNYDEGGKVWKMVRKMRVPRPEPGKWRVEVVPPQAKLRDRFLMVLKPSLRGESNPTRVVPLEERDWVGCRLLGGARTLRLKFPRDRDGVVVGFESGRRIDLTVEATK